MVESNPETSEKQPPIIIIIIIIIIIMSFILMVCCPHEKLCHSMLQKIFKFNLAVNFFYFLSN